MTTPPVKEIAYATGSATDPNTGTWAGVAVAPSGSGSTLQVSVHGVATGGRCRLMVHDAAGHAVPAGDWTVGDPRDPPYHETVAVAPAAIRRVEVIDARTGRRLVEVAIHPV